MKLVPVFILVLFAMMVKSTHAISFKDPVLTIHNATDQTITATVTALLTFYGVNPKVTSCAIKPNSVSFINVVTGRTNTEQEVIQQNKTGQINEESMMQLPLRNAMPKEPYAARLAVIKATNDLHTSITIDQQSTRNNGLNNINSISIIKDKNKPDSLQWIGSAAKYVRPARFYDN